MTTKVEENQIADPLIKDSDTLVRSIQSSTIKIVDDGFGNLTISTDLTPPVVETELWKQVNWSVNGGNFWSTPTTLTTQTDGTRYWSYEEKPDLLKGYRGSLKLTFETSYNIYGSFFRFDVLNLSSGTAYVIADSINSVETADLGQGLKEYELTIDLSAVTEDFDDFGLDCPYVAPLNITGLEKI